MINCIFCSDQKVSMIQLLGEVSGPPTTGHCNTCGASYNSLGPLAEKEKIWDVWFTQFKYEDDGKKWVIRYHPYAKRMDIFAYERRLRAVVSLNLTEENMANPPLTPLNAKEKLQTYITFS